MIKIKLTWPALILILIALAVYLARDPGQRNAPSLRTPRRPASPARRQALPDHDGGDYEIETRRLDEAAAAAGQQVFDEEIIIDLPEPSWRKKS